jgi:hypothetical protein
VGYQKLHRDTGDYFGDHGGRGGVDYRDMPCHAVTVNFPMEVRPGSAVGHSGHNGATRTIPGTQASHAAPPPVAREPRWMKLSMVAPLAAGGCVIRDQRAWHGGTPNLSREVRQARQRV